MEACLYLRLYNTLVLFDVIAYIAPLSLLLPLNLISCLHISLVLIHAILTLKNTSRSSSARSLVVNCQYSLNVLVKSSEL